MIPFCILAIENDEDREFMTTLYIHYKRLLYSEIFKILQDPWDTEDVLQATLVKLINKIPELQEKETSRLVNYIITAAKNTAYNFLRAKKKAPLPLFDDYFEDRETSAEYRQMEFQFMTKELLDTLARLWPKLDRRSKILLEGKYILGKSDESLAEELSIKPASVRMALVRARQCAYQLLSSE